MNRILPIAALCLALLGSPTVLHAENLDELQAILSGDASAVPAETALWKCSIDKQVACKKENCSELPASDRIELDFNNNIYNRCNKDNGCKQFRMMVSRSGEFTVVALPENGVTFKAADTDSSFSEAASVGDVVVNSFGSCTKGPREKASTPATTSPARPSKTRLKTARQSEIPAAAANLRPMPDIPQPRSMNKGYAPFEASASSANPAERTSW